MDRTRMRRRGGKSKSKKKQNTISRKSSRSSSRSSQNESTQGYSLVQKAAVTAAIAALTAYVVRYHIMTPEQVKELSKLNKQNIIDYMIGKIESTGYKPPTWISNLKTQQKSWWQIFS